MQRPLPLREVAATGRGSGGEQQRPPRAVAAPGTKGVAVVLVNWSGADRVAGLNVTVRVAAVKQLGAAVKATRASGGAVTTHAATEDGWPWFAVKELGVADALILRA